MKSPPFNDKLFTHYWLKVFGVYAITEACIQLLFNYVLNNFVPAQISNLEFHSVMWLFQCITIIPIWWIAYLARKKSLLTQVAVNLVFFFIYTWFWLDPVQQMIQSLHQHLQQITRPVSERILTPVDTSYIYQFVKHAFRLSWFFLADYFYNYQTEEEKRRQLAVANEELELKLLKWHLNPAFYFKTIAYLKELSLTHPASCTKPILHLAKVMDYVIYESREKLIDVSKEINFLNHYTELINHQKNYAAKFSIVTKGSYDKLKIVPLMLAEFIDSIITANGPCQNDYAICMLFSGNSMLFQVKGDNEQQEKVFSDANNLYNLRLKEMYDDNFSRPGIRGHHCIEFNVNLYA